MKQIKRKATYKITGKTRKEYIKSVKQSAILVVITLKCKKCKSVFKVNTTTPEAYTDEVKKKWHCLFCVKDNK